MREDNKIDLNRYFIKETPIAKKDMGRCSASFACR